MPDLKCESFEQNKKCPIQTVKHAKKNKKCPIQNKKKAYPNPKIALSKPQKCLIQNVKHSEKNKDILFSPNDFSMPKTFIFFICLMFHILERILG